MGSGGSKNKSGAENKTNNSGSDRVQSPTSKQGSGVNETQQQPTKSTSNPTHQPTKPTANPTEHQPTNSSANLTQQQLTKSSANPIHENQQQPQSDVKPSQQHTKTTTDYQHQVPPTEEKLPPLNNTQIGEDINPKPEDTKDPVCLPSIGETPTEVTGNSKSGTTDPTVKEDIKNAQDEEAKDVHAQGEVKKEMIVPEVEEKIIVEEPQDQKKFDSALRCSCLLIKPESVFKHVTQNVTKLHLPRALPLHFPLDTLLSKFVNLREVDLSNNNLGPQGFRAICLAMCSNNTILSLNLAANKSDTDSADSIGRMLEENKTLQYLDVSSNYLGKDYFSRRVGPALKVNTSLQTLRCESIGTTDARLFIGGLQENTTLVELDISQNELSNKLGFAKGLTECLKRTNCTLTTLCLTRCGFDSASIIELTDGIANNTSLEELNLSGSEFDNLEVILRLTIMAIRHPRLHNLCLDNSSVKSLANVGHNPSSYVDPVCLLKPGATKTSDKPQQPAQTETPSVESSLQIPTGLPMCEEISPLQILSVKSCGLVDAFFTSLLKSCEGKLLLLIEVDLASNEHLTVGCIEDLIKMTSCEDRPSSSLRKISYGLNKADDIPEVLTNRQLQNLGYLNLRMCRISAESVGQLARCWEDPGCVLSTLVLDGLKLSGTTALKALLGTPKKCKLSVLSLGGCQLDDADLVPLNEALKSGLPLHMLKLAANRVSDAGLALLAEALMKNKAAQISVLDLSNNRITDEGVKCIVKLVGSKSKLNSLNVSSNSIGKDGLLLLSGLLNGKSPLQSLHAQGQSKGLDEPHMIEIYTKLTSSLGYKVQMDGDQVKPGCSDLPSTIPERLLVNFTNMGGQTGSIGRAIDSPCILTDQPGDRLPTLTLNNVFGICNFMKGHHENVCVWSEKDWDMIIGADRATTDAPSWLKLPESRNRCIYMSNLPGNTTQQKVDAMLEMEADCNLEEACLMKDPVTRNVNGFGWALMGDTDSVQKALDLFNSGQAKVFGQPFIISEVKVKVDNEANSLLEKTAAVDRENRLKERAKEEASHRNLIATTTEASWKRHAYRLAHPAYADGRIW